jgi:hypothetical protein
MAIDKTRKIPRSPEKLLGEGAAMDEQVARGQAFPRSTAAPRRVRST